MNLVKFLILEYPRRAGVEELTSILQDTIVHNLSKEQIEELSNARKLENVNTEILKLIAESLYLRQEFKRSAYEY